MAEGPDVAQPSVALILLNYNSAHHTIDCLRSLENVLYENLRILVVDNGSTDDSLAAIRSASAGTEIIETGQNLGFAGGNNVGIKHLLASRPEYILLLNNDTLVEPDFLLQLVARMERDPGSGAAGGTICYHPEVDSIWYAGGDYVFWRATGIHRFLDKPRAIVDNLRTADVSFITGCLMLIRASVLEEIGLLDERFFMYTEDLEFSLRLMRAGHRLVYEPTAVIYHKIRHRGDTPLTVYYGLRSRLILVRYCVFGWKKLIASSYLAVVLSVKLVAWYWKKADLFRSGLMAVSDFRKGNFDRRLDELHTHKKSAGA